MSVHVQMSGEGVAIIVVRRERAGGAVGSTVNRLNQMYLSIFIIE